VTTKISQDYFTRRSERVERNWSKTLSPEARDELEHYVQQPQTRRRPGRDQVPQNTTSLNEGSMRKPVAAGATILQAQSRYIAQGVLARASSGKSGLRRCQL
jgi:hypothetical protein